MTPYRTTPTAERHLRRIRSQSIARWGRDHADRYLTEMDAAVRAIIADPDLARPRPTLHPDLRVRRFKAHQLYVAILPDGLVLVAVLHRAMEAQTRLAGVLRDLGDT